MTDGFLHVCYRQENAQSGSKDRAGDSSKVKKAGFSSRGSSFDSQNTPGSLPSLTPVLGESATLF